MCPIDGVHSRLRHILLRLQEATHPGSVEAPGFRLHPLKGSRAGQWSVRVSGNWPAASAAYRLTDDLLTPAVSAILPTALP